MKRVNFKKDEDMTVFYLFILESHLMCAFPIISYRVIVFWLGKYTIKIQVDVRAGSVILNNENSVLEPTERDMWFYSKITCKSKLFHKRAAHLCCGRRF